MLDVLNARADGPPATIHILLSRSATTSPHWGWLGIDCEWSLVIFVIFIIRIGDWRDHAGAMQTAQSRFIEASTRYLFACMICAVAEIHTSPCGDDESRIWPIDASKRS
jgi:hypothetical protein